MDPKFSQDLYTANITENAAEGVVLIFFSLMSGSEKRSLATPVSFPGVYTGGSCHKYHFCRDKNTCFVSTKVIETKDGFCRDKHVFVATNVSLFVATKLLPRQTYSCRDKTFASSNILLSRQKTCYVATNPCLSRQNICRDKKYTCGSSRQC